jgi:hypothetical protein
MAKQESDKILYSLNESFIRVEWKTKERSGASPKPTGKKNSSQYNLHSWARLMLDGSIKEASHEFYDTKFKEALNKFKSNGEAKLFLDHHFENTHDKRALLNRIETHIIRRYKTNQNDILLNENKIELVAEWIREKKKELPKEKEAKLKSEPTHFQLALAYFYMILSEEIEPFDYWDAGAVEAYKKVVADHKPKAKETAWKKFQQGYSKVQGAKAIGRKELCDSSVKNFTIVCDLLSKHPNALAIAKKELKK